MLSNRSGVHLEGAGVVVVDDAVFVVGISVRAACVDLADSLGALVLLSKVEKVDIPFNSQNILMNITLHF